MKLKIILVMKNGFYRIEMFVRKYLFFFFLGKESQIDLGKLDFYIYILFLFSIQLFKNIYFIVIDRNVGVLMYFLYVLYNNKELRKFIYWENSQ